MSHEVAEQVEQLPLGDRVLTFDEMDDLLSSEEQPPEITYSTQDFPVDALVKRLDRGTMRIPQFGVDEPKNRVEGFQRGFVWNKAQMDRFIESLLLGYPVPSIFMVKQADNAMLVLDGQQRLETLRRFYAGIHEDKVFKLENVGEDFKGLSYADMDEDLRLKLDDSFMHATIVATDGSKSVNDAIYGIFERLNSGGTQLTPHEIRVALFAGQLMVLVEKLNNDENWRELFGPKNKRIRDHELVMRILALYLKAEKYRRPLKRFLNDFSDEFRDSSELPNDAESNFLAAAEVLNQSVGKQSFRRTTGSQVNTAQAEAIMIAVMRNIAEGTLTSEVSVAIDKLLNNDAFAKATTRATADNDAVSTRLREATTTLARS
ncbi:MAG: DUF262 domain-containing protein [Leucobacter sp.]